MALLNTQLAIDGSHLVQLGLAIDRHDCSSAHHRAATYRRPAKCLWHALLLQLCTKILDGWMDDGRNEEYPGLPSQPPPPPPPSLAAGSPRRRATLRTAPGDLARRGSGSKSKSCLGRAHSRTSRSLRRCRGCGAVGPPSSIPSQKVPPLGRTRFGRDRPPPAPPACLGRG